MIAPHPIVPVVKDRWEMVAAEAARLTAMAQKPVAHAATQMMVRPVDLRIDRAYQRFAREDAVEAIMRDFNPILLGSILVSLRSDGDWYVIDGQHRVLALMRLGRERDEVPALVYEGLTPAEEAYIFSESQRRRRDLTALESFRSDLIWHEPVAVGILEIARRVGFDIRTDGDIKTTDNGNIAAIHALRNVYERYAHGPEVLERTLTVIRDTWGLEQGPPNLIIGGVATFINYFDVDGQLSFSRLVTVLERMTQRKWIAEGQTDAAVLPSAVPVGVAHAIHKKYQLKLTTNALPSWEEAVQRVRARRGAAGGQGRQARR